MYHIYFAALNVNHEIQKEMGGKKFTRTVRFCQFMMITKIWNEAFFICILQQQK